MHFNACVNQQCKPFTAEDGNIALVVPFLMGTALIYS